MMSKQKSYKIYIKDENGTYTICVCGQNRKAAVFDCIYAAEQYAKSIGLKSGFIIK